MKIRILGLTIFEIETNLSAMPPGPPPGLPAKSAKSRRPTAIVPAASRPLADLHKAADLLPRKARGTLDVEAGLRMFALKDAAVLWEQKYPSGSAGAALKRALGSIGRKPVLPANWRRLSSKGIAPGANHHTGRPPAPLSSPKPETLRTQPAEKVSAARDTSAPSLPSDAHGHIDIAASLQVLGLIDPKALWKGKIQPGSAAHELKKEIARVLARGETVTGITRRDIGLPE